VLGEGVGAVLLKPLRAALADGDRIHAVIEGSAVNNDGRTMGLTTPNLDAQQRLVAEALDMAGAGADTVSYVEAHGTGTMIGDPIELKALTTVFNGFTRERGYCAVGSVKSNVGHLLLASGMAGLHKVVLSLMHRQLPPTLHCDTPNPRFDFADSPFFPNTTLRDWEPRHGVRRAGLSAFGFGGTNAHVVLRELTAAERATWTPARSALPPATLRRRRFWLERRRPQEATSDSTSPRTGANGHTTLRSPLLALQEGEL
jgi:acyl transferase domain-containing protein